MSRFRGLLDARTRGLRRFVRLRSGAGGARALLRGAAGLALVPAFHGAVTPDAEAIVDGDRRLTWRDFDRRVRGLASGLRATYRLRPGDRGLLCLHNRLEVLETAAALHRLGVDVAFASPYGSDRELAETVGRIAPQLVVHDRAPMAPRPAQLPMGPAYEALAEGPSGPLPPVLRGPAVTLFTSGTTGLPKAVRRSVGGAPGAARLLEGVLEGLGAFWRIPMGPADRHLVLCPLHHLTGLGFALLTLAFGGTVVIAGRFDAARARALLIEERIDTAAVVPTMLRRLLDVDAPRPLLRALYSAGAPLTPELSRRAQEAFGPVLYNIYGATETGLNLVATPADLTAAPGTLGRALPGQRLRLVDDEGREVATGEVGELVVESVFLPEGIAGAPPGTCSGATPRAATTSRGVPRT
jgi:fatty-acyl-CoA synthase